MPSPRQVLASLIGADRATKWSLVGELGRIRWERRAKGRAFYLDFRPYGLVWSNRGIRITDRATAERLLQEIRGKVAERDSLESVLADYVPTTAKLNQVPSHLVRWLAVKRREMEASSLSPSYFRDLELYSRPGGYFSFFDKCAVHEITYGVLEDFSLELADRNLSPKSRRNALGAFRSFLGWLKKRGELHELPEFPWPKVNEYEPRILSIEDQDAILEAIPERERGIFLALALLGLRPGEARALDIADYANGWLIVDKAVKGSGSQAPIRGTKTGKGKRLPVGEVLEAWITRWVAPATRLTGAPLFVNPRTGQRWTHWALRDQWRAAAARVGVTDARLYEGTKHTMATDAIRRGVSERALQAFLGHSDARSTRRYARFSEHALVAVLRPRPRFAEEAEFVGGLSVNRKTQKYVESNQRVMASPTGFEPEGDVA